MSYARLNSADSDVYVYADVSGGITCCFCALKVNAHRLTTDAMLPHLRDHVGRGHRVPEHLFAEIEADREENDASLGGTA